MLRLSAESTLGAAVGMDDRAAEIPAARRDRLCERIGDQLSEHVIGDRPAERPFGVLVALCTQV